SRTKALSHCHDREGNVLSRSWQWLKAFVRDRDAPIITSLSTDAVYSEVAAKDKGPHTPVVEPRLKLEKGVFVAVPGKEGSGIAPAAIIKALDGAVEGTSPIKISIGRGKVKPRLTLEQVPKLAAEAGRLTATPLGVGAGPATAEVSTAML